ncbi:barstar family protein [Ornithinimicrobium faecis]|uniref:Barstar family protein n=1 Tax=Ornithinimicrobium faecis TaxID=2934158 RepID=A0ABY4YU52_9MICO|nr:MULTISPECIES: barstar family protein [unclassified Ornithinimicrobium]USQ80296.1 barstar family protein [Ornithinimicrobium sp. HY1793]
MPSGSSSKLTRVHDVLPALRGRGVILASPQDGEHIRQHLGSVGFTVVEADLPAELRAAQATIAGALRLPETAARNLDALVDSLRDLATWWPDDERIVLLLHGAESLVEGDLPGWHTLTEILQRASADLWRGGAQGDRAFETIALVDRHGVARLPEAQA